MKFSVLLPTRNRLELLKYAVETVLLQDYDDWEIIVSDNFSDQDIAGYVRSLAEARIHYYRTDSFVPVTDNWNNALSKSSGDYVIMLGDDDCLMKGYFSTINRLIIEYNSPDFIYTNALLYAYPGVLPGAPDSSLRKHRFPELFGSAKTPMLFDKDRARRLVRKSMRFSLRFGYNMQFAIVNRYFINKIQDKGPFFQSPYPDYYAMNVLFLVAERIVIYPKPLVTIGISPKSFGFYYFNNSEQSGVDFLKNVQDPNIVNRIQAIILPGTNMNTSWLCAMETIARNFSTSANVKVHYHRYRFLQILQVHIKYCLNRNAAKAELFELWRLLDLKEKLITGLFLLPVSLALRILPHYLRKKAIVVIMIFVGTYPRFPTTRITGNYTNILDVFSKIDPQQQ